VLMYTVKLADACGIDLPAACARKMRLNEDKYPVGGGGGKGGGGPRGGPPRGGAPAGGGGGGGGAYPCLQALLGGVVCQYPRLGVIGAGVDGGSGWDRCAQWGAAPVPRSAICTDGTERGRRRQ